MKPHSCRVAQRLGLSARSPENSHTTLCSAFIRFLTVKTRLQRTKAPKEEEQSWLLEELSWGTENLES